MLLTQSDLAALLDVSRPTVSYYETGHARVPRTVELAIEALLRRQVVELGAPMKAEPQNA
jgi:DNA-binding XRE family transcriptional regulator